LRAPERALDDVPSERRESAARGWLRALAPLLLTAGAAVLGYAFALFPIWHQARRPHGVETLGNVIADAKLRESVLTAYDPQSGLAIAGFDDVEWRIPTVMTPFVGYGPRPGRRHNAFIDSYQFRGKRELSTPKPAGTVRIFVTGASVAFGSGASSDDHTVGAYLQRSLDRRGGQNGRRYEVFTFATPDWWSTHERIAIENRVSELEPDLVVWLTGIEDAAAGEMGKNVFWARSATDQYYWNLANIALQQSRFGPMVDVQDVGPQPLPPEIVASRLRKNVALAAFALSKSKARLHLFLPPHIVATRKPLSALEQRVLSRSQSFRDYYARCRERFRTLLRADGVPDNVSFTDLSGIFDTVAETQLVFVAADHFGDRGDSMIAEAIAKALLVDDPSLFGASDSRPKNAG
jgi:hypothetical protein